MFNKNIKKKKKQKKNKNIIVYNSYCFLFKLKLIKIIAKLKLIIEIHNLGSNKIIHWKCTKLEIKK